MNRFTNRIYPVLWREIQKRRNHDYRTQTSQKVEQPPWPPLPCKNIKKSSTEKTTSDPPQWKEPPSSPCAAKGLEDILELYFARPSGSCGGRPLPAPCPYCYRAPLCSYPPQLCPPCGPRVPQCEACQSSVSHADPTTGTKVPTYEKSAKQSPWAAPPPLTQVSNQLKARLRNVYAKLPKESPVLPLLVGLLLGGCTVGLYNQYACAVYKMCVRKMRHRPAGKNPSKS